MTEKELDKKLEEIGAMESPEPNPFIWTKVQASIEKSYEIHLPMKLVYTFGFTFFAVLFFNLFAVIYNGPSENELSYTEYSYLQNKNYYLYK